MKLALIFLTALLANNSAQAAVVDLQEIFQSLANETGEGNGNGHFVTRLKGPFNEELEIANLTKAVHEDNSGTNDCKFDINANIEGAIKEVNDNWEAAATAERLAGMNKNGLLKQIVYSEWDPSTGDSEYCSMSTMKVFGIDGSVLIFDFNETD